MLQFAFASFYLCYSYGHPIMDDFSLLMLVGLK